jgi:hypothetical protein
MKRQNVGVTQHTVSTILRVCGKGDMVDQVRVIPSLSLSRRLFLVLDAPKPVPDPLQPPESVGVVGVHIHAFAALCVVCRAQAAKGKPSRRGLAMVQND